MTHTTLERAFALLGALAALQLALPAQGAARPMMVALCGGGAPIRLPTKNHDPEKQSCKICHSAMRGRFAGGNCCGDSEDEEDPGP